MERFKYLSKDEITRLPKNSGVYAFKKGAKLLYIGKASNIRERVKNHLPSRAKRGEALEEFRSPRLKPRREKSEALRTSRPFAGRAPSEAGDEASLQRPAQEGDETKFQRPQQSVFRDNLFINQVSKIGYLKTGSEIEALIWEANLIKKHQPKYNVVWRDDKNYFFVGIAKEDFPRVFLTHQTKLKTKNLKLKTDFIGPFVDGKALKQTLKILRKVFPYRSCRVLPNRPCLWYHLNRCPAPCLLKKAKIPLLPSNRVFIKMKKESQQNAKNLMKILKEGRVSVLKNLKKEMKLAAKNQNFETAAKIRDQIGALEKVIAHARIFESGISQKRDWPEIQKSLCQMLKTNPPKFCSPATNFEEIWAGKAKLRPARIEAYDVSNIVGQEATGSMVTFINDKPNKNFYRHFRIKAVGKPNDIAMLKECLTRRFRHKEWGLPDLILIDGGKAQLNAAILKTKNYKLKTKVMALAKKRNELFIENQKKPILLKSLPPKVSNLILQLRDEAHRFALSYHRKLRESIF